MCCDRACRHGAGGCHHSMVPGRRPPFPSSGSMPGSLQQPNPTTPAGPGGSHPCHPGPPAARSAGPLFPGRLRDLAGHGEVGGEQSLAAVSDPADVVLLCALLLSQSVASQICREPVSGFSFPLCSCGAPAGMPAKLHGGNPTNSVATCVQLRCERSQAGRDQPLANRGGPWDNRPAGGQRRLPRTPGRAQARSLPDP